MEIKVFGPGCPRCAQTESLVREVAAAKGSDIAVIKVSDYKEMMAHGIMSTPAVAVDGVVKAAGRIPGEDEIAAWIDGASGEAQASSENGGNGCGCGGNGCGCGGNG